MTDDELTTLERLAEAASPGPWEVSNAHGLCVSRPHGPHVRMMVVDLAPEVYSPPWRGDPADAAFIAAARTALPALIAECRRLRDDLSSARGLAHARGLVTLGDCQRTMAAEARIAALEAQNASDRAVQGEAEHRALERADALQLIVEGTSTVSLGCSWCDTWGIPTKEALREHAASCPKHPGNQRAEKAEARVAELEELVEEMRRQADDPIWKRLDGAAGSVVALLETEGAAAERAAIVAWVRTAPEADPTGQAYLALARVADGIETGAHIPKVELSDVQDPARRGES